jgi:hypothetical protein
VINAKFVNARPMSGIVRVTVDISPADFAKFNALLSDDFRVGLDEPPSLPKQEKPAPKKAVKEKAQLPPTPLEEAIAKVPETITIVTHQTAPKAEPAPQVPAYRGTGQEIDGYPIAERDIDGAKFVYKDGAMIPYGTYMATRHREPVPEMIEEPAGSAFDDHDDHGGTPHDDDQSQQVSAYEERVNPEDAPPDDGLDIPGFLKRDHPQAEPVGSAFDDEGV